MVQQSLSLIPFFVQPNEPIPLRYMSEIVNKIQQSGLINLDLGELYPKGDRVIIDLKDQLWEGLALKEKDFRVWIKEHDWSQYEGAFVSVDCSADAIVPTWAFMLVSVHVQPYASFVTAGSNEQLERAIFTRFIERLDLTPYTDGRVVIKGCSTLPVPLSAYAELTAKLTPITKSLMFGEPCSTVPLYKKPK